MKVTKKLFFVALLLSLILFIGAVTAQDNITFEQSNIQTISNELDIQNDAELSSDENSQVVEVDNDIAVSVDFRDIQDKIDSANEGDTIFLNGETYYGFSQINVTKKLTIIGGSSLEDTAHSTLVAEDQTRIMEIASDNVVLKGITFINGHAPYIQYYYRYGWMDMPTDAGAISIRGDNCNIINCDFIDNVATNNGGAISITGNTCRISYSNFINNSAIDGGAIYVNSDNVEVIDCNFTYNQGSSAAAIESKGKNFTIINGTFTNNQAYYDGGAIRYRGLNTSILNSKFVNNSVTNRDGGTIIGTGNNATLMGNMISHSYANRNGGAIYINANNVHIECNNFYMNSAGENGDNIWISGVDNSILNNFFCGPISTPMGIYEVNQGDTIIENNDYRKNYYVIEVNSSFVDFVGKTIQIPVYVHDYRNSSMSGTVTLYGYGEQTLINGKAMFIVNLPYYPGVLHSYVKYDDEINYISIESVARDSIVSITQNNENDDVIVEFLPGASGSVIVNIEGVNYFAEAINGTAIVKPKGLINGEYVAIVLYSGDNEYPSKWKVTTINIKQNPVYDISENKDVAVGYTDKVTYKVLITKDGKSVSDESITISFNGKNTVVKTDSNGYATLNLDTNLKPGTYYVKAIYNGVSVTNKVKITQIIKASDKKVKKSAKVTKIKISLNKVDGKFLKSKTLKIKFNGKVYNVKTNSKGVAIWKVKKSMLKKFKVGKKVKYTVSYGKDTVTKKLTVKK